MYSRNIVEKIGVFSPYPTEALDRLVSILDASPIEEQATEIIEDGAWVWTVQNVNVVENEGFFENQFHVIAVKIDGKTIDINEYLY